MVGPNLATAPGEQLDAAVPSSMALLTTANQAETEPKADFSKLLTVAELNAIMCVHMFKWGECTKGCCQCIHGRVKSFCKECGGSQICTHGRQKGTCKECGGSRICPHGRQKGFCKECGGSRICTHGRQKSFCKECGGSQICPHGTSKSSCKHADCAAAKVAMKAAKAAKKAERG
jgi:hypothetical protein